MVAQLEDDVDEFEERDVESESARHSPLDDVEAVTALSEYRKHAVKLRRWIGPQREALKDLLLKGGIWLLRDWRARRHAAPPGATRRHCEAHCREGWAPL